MFKIGKTLINPEDFEYIHALHWRRKVEHRLTDLGIQPSQPLTSVIFKTRYPNYSTIFYGDSNQPIDYDKYLENFGFLNRKTGQFTVMPRAELCNRVSRSKTHSIKCMGTKR